MKSYSNLKIKRPDLATNWYFDSGALRRDCHSINLWNLWTKSHNAIKIKLLKGRVSVNIQSSNSARLTICFLGNTDYYVKGALTNFISPQNLQRTQDASNDNVLRQWRCYISVHGCVYATVFSGQANPGQIYRNSSEYFQEKGTSQMPIPFQNNRFLLLKRLSF